ncbi:MAG: sigma-70 family RNA polymerase sigma factor, partial [Clostridiales bacterium]|nr:sigma-70 family RNA polymerase sigma factor [Clostridiales bacterium]
MAEKNDQKMKDNTENKAEVFQKKLPELLALAKKNKNMLEYQEVGDFFKDFDLNAEQMERILDYLEANNVDVLRIGGKDEDILIDTEEAENIDAEEEIDLGKIDLSVPDGVSLEDPVRMYLKEIGKVPLLNAEEEISLAKEMEAGINASEEIERLEAQLAQASEDEKEALQSEIAALKKVADKGAEAKKRLAEANLRLVVSIAKRYVGRGMLFLDLIQEGNLGLIKAVEKFDYKKGYKFSTYATCWIRQAITRAIADQARTLRVPG